MQRNNYKIKCTYCDREFSSINKRNLHMMKSRKFGTCRNNCFAPLSDMNMYTFKCELCNFGTNNEKENKMHRRSQNHYENTRTSILENKHVRVISACNGKIVRYDILNPNIVKDRRYRDILIRNSDGNAESDVDENSSVDNDDINNSNNETFDEMAIDTFSRRVKSIIKQIIELQMLRSDRTDNDGNISSKRRLDAEKSKSLKVQLSFHNILSFDNAEHTRVERLFGITNNNIILFESDLSNLDNIINRQIEEMVARMEEFYANGSSYAFIATRHITITLATYEPLRGGCIKRIRLPKFIANKNALILDPISTKYNDNNCFRRAIEAYAHHFNKDLTNIDFNDLNTPTSLDDIRAFEDKNEILVRVYEIKNVSDTDVEDWRVVPIHCRRNELDSDVFHLLFTRDTR